MLKIFNHDCVNKALFQGTTAISLEKNFLWIFGRTSCRVTLTMWTLTLAPSVCSNLQKVRYQLVRLKVLCIEAEKWYWDVYCWSQSLSCKKADLWTNLPSSQALTATPLLAHSCPAMICLTGGPWGAESGWSSSWPSWAMDAWSLCSPSAGTRWMFQGSWSVILLRLTSSWDCILVSVLRNSSIK